MSEQQMKDEGFPEYPGPQQTQKLLWFVLLAFFGCLVFLVGHTTVRHRINEIKAKCQSNKGWVRPLA